MIIPIPEIKEGLATYLKEIDYTNSDGQSLIRYAHNIGNIEEDLIVDSIIQDYKKVFYFNRPEEKLVLLAFEELFSIRNSINNKFSRLQDIISDISVKSVDNFNKNLKLNFPLFFGGTKFCSVNNSIEWKDFSNNDWFIPTFLFYKKGQEQYLVITLTIKDITTPGPKINDLLEPLYKFNKKHISPGSDKQMVSIKVIREDEEYDHWKLLVNGVLVKIKNGLYRKVVLSRRLKAEISEWPIFYFILNQFKNTYGNCNIFLYKSGDSVLFGATPEQLLKFRNKEIEFDALAGSARRGTTIEEDELIACNLLNDQKNGSEHNHVIDFIKEVSLRYVEDFRQSETSIKKFSNIQHLYTPIKGVLKSKDKIFSLVEDIFPTPAICGLPKDSALDYIIENEKFDRGMYSGIVGFIGSDEMDLSVAIRSALLTLNNLYIYAGCGIVDGSDAQSEFDETEIKMKPILSLFKNED